MLFSPAPDSNFATLSGYPPKPSADFAGEPLAGTDILYLKRAYELAARGYAQTEPNPRVGALLVLRGRIIGEGFHPKAGEPHAEVFAVRNCNDPSSVSESTLYVTLEPCCHHGRTPPCTSLILEQGIRRVVVGQLDPNPKVAGKGVALLRAAGVQVDILNPVAEPNLHTQLWWQNRHFWFNQSQGQSYLTLKWAETPNRRMGSRAGRLAISGAAALHWGHHLRAEHAAILIGAGTLLADNPLLNNRLAPGPNPTRLVLSQGNTPTQQLLAAQLFKEGSAPSYLCLPQHSPEPDASSDPRIWWVPPPLTALAGHLYAQRGVGSVLVEGGAKLLGALLAAGLGQEVHILKSNLTQAAADVPAPNWQADGFRLVYTQLLGTDTVEVWLRN